MSKSAGECKDTFKQAFDQPSRAQRAADSMNRRANGDKRRKVRIYECPAGHWHVTGTSSFQKQKHKARLRERK